MRDGNGHIGSSSVLRFGVRRVGPIPGMVAIASIMFHAQAAAVLAADAPATLHPGAIEIGIAGSLVDDEGALTATLESRGGSFAKVGPGLFGFELDTGWLHAAEFDRLRILCTPTWQQRLRSPGVWLTAGFVGGWSEEWIGSFHQARFPLGFTAGVRLIPAESVAARIDYRWLRLVDDPVRDPTEQQVLVGISWLIRNHGAPASD